VFGWFMGKKRLLYISAVIPKSTGGGSGMRAASHIKVLSALFDITLAIVGDHGHEMEVHRCLADDVKAACVSVAVISRISVINRLLRRTRSFRARVVLEALWPTPLLFAPYPPSLAELARQLAGEHFDVVHCFRLYAAPLRLLTWRGIRIGRSVLDLDDYQSRAEFRSANAFRMLIGKGLWAVSWLNVAKWWILEALLIPSFDDALVCSELDRQRLRCRFPGIRWHVVPNTVAEPPEFHPARSDPFTFLFVGVLGYLPNWDAVLFFCTHVLPILRRIGPRGFRVLIVGRTGYDLNLERLRAIEEVCCVLDAPDLSPYYAQSDAVIVPIRSGGGTRIKILEAFSYGLPVVSTGIGAEGLDVTPGSDIIIADGAEAFAEQCHRIWTDDLLRQRIARGGHDLWRQKYNPAALVAALETAYECYVDRRKRRDLGDPGDGRRPKRASEQNKAT
jgi:polysaccharide biosynthesis protein PslH